MIRSLHPRRIHPRKTPATRSPRPGFGRTAVVLLLAIVTFGCSQDVDSRLGRAIALQESGNLAQSIVVLRAILVDDVASPDANFLLGSALIQLGKERLAIAPLELAAASEIYGIPAGLLLSATQFRTNAFRNAIRTTTRVLELDPDNITALVTRGRSYLETNRPEDALRDANHVLDFKPGAQTAIVIKAEALVGLDRRDEAESIWLALRDEGDASGDSSQAANACGQLAGFHATNGEDDRAETIYRECLAEYPTHPLLQISASEFHSRLDQTERALEILQNGIDASPDDIRAWYRLSDTLYQQGEIDAALQNLEKMVEHLDSPGAWRVLAGFHRKIRQITEARIALEEAILRSEEPPEAFLYSLTDLLVEEGQIQRAREVGQGLVQPSYRHLLAGAISLKTGNPQRALARLDAGLALWPDNSYAHYLAGQAALQLRDRRRALVEFLEALRIGDANTDAALRLAEIYFARGNYPKAAKIARYQIETRPYLDPQPYHIAIRSLMGFGRVEAAIEVANALFARDPDTPTAIVEIAAIKRFQSGASASSVYVLASGRDLADPGNEPILRSLSNDLNTLGRGTEALAYIDLAIASDDAVASLHDLRARVLSQLGRTAEATQTTRRALEIDPDFAPALEMKAYFALEAGDQKTALAALDAATAAAPANSNHPYDAASIARKMGDTAGAIARLEETLARQPLFGPAANDLAWILATDRLDLERALVLAQIAAQQNRSSDTLTTLGWVRHQRGEYDDAIENYRTALEEDADLATVRYRLGLALSEAGQTTEAERLFNALVEGPDFPEIDAARAELQRIQGS
jgi:tetratricopeptide (TPR) repeat protein